MVRRHEISDEQWNIIKDHLPGKEGDPGATAKDNRLFINAIFWIAKTGVLGVICRNGSARGTACFRDSIAGARMACSPKSWIC